MRSILIYPCVVFFTSCVLGPEPGNPDVALPSSIRGDMAPHGTSFGDKSWRKVFSDPTLYNLIARALSNNPDLVAATYRIEEARARAQVVRSAYFPNINGSAAGSTDYSSRNAGQGNATGERSSESYNLTGLLSWELDLWGGIKRDNQAARARLLESEYQRDAVQTSLIAAVASSYIDLQNLDERLAIARRTIESRKGSLELVTARRDGGVSSDLEVGQAQALLSQAQILVPTTERAIVEKENEIRALLGEYPGGITRGGSLDKLDSSLRIAAGLPSLLIARRPDISAANQSFQAATAEIGVAEALRLPTLSLTGQGGVISGDFNKLLQGNSAAYSIGPQLAGPIFDAGRGKARVEGAKARAKIALSDYQKSAQQAFQEAANSLNAYQKTGEIIVEQTKLVKSQMSVSSIALDRFQGGASSYLEVLDAERELFSAELDLADARSNRLRAVVQAYRALGGGWQ
ncbi:MAG: efflux transporter outer membrane subunit [Gloeobacteraceae cyanobacterium ES-bin-144]|nr:efflux transporter outer membrane subunit [Verrucomicrobiales bacterium]